MTWVDKLLRDRRCGSTWKHVCPKSADCWSPRIAAMRTPAHETWRYVPRNGLQNRNTGTTVHPPQHPRRRGQATRLIAHETRRHVAGMTDRRAPPRWRWCRPRRRSGSAAACPPGCSTPPGSTAHTSIQTQSPQSHGPKQLGGARALRQAGRRKYLSFKRHEQVVLRGPVDLPCPTVASRCS